MDQFQPLCHVPTMESLQVAVHHWGKSRQKKNSSRSLEAKTEAETWSKATEWLASHHVPWCLSYTAQVYVPSNGIQQCGQLLNDPPTCTHISLMEAFLHCRGILLPICNKVTPSISHHSPQATYHLPTFAISLYIPAIYSALEDRM